MDKDVRNALCRVRAKINRIQTLANQDVDLLKIIATLTKIDFLFDELISDFTENYVSENKPAAA